MYCGQCGKKILDTMLFCPFCGSPVVIPDQDEPESAAPLAPEPSVQPAPEPPASPATVEEESAPEPLFEEPREGEVEPEEIDFESEATTEPKAPDEPEDAQAWPEAEAADAQGASESGEAEAEGSLFFDAPEAPAPPEPEAEEPAAQRREGRGEAARPTSLFEELDAPPQEDFTPLNLERMRRLEEDFPSLAKAVAAQQQKQPPRARPPKPGTRRTSPTLIPVKDVDPDDIFMDHSHPRREEERDPYDEASADGEEDFAFEEGEAGSFLQRHVRGVVGLILLAALLVIFLIWAAMPGGQRVLATANLAWNASVYNDLGYEAYEAGQYERAAAYFERAFARDGDNYDYAHSAMVAYYEAEDTDASLTMLKKCIEMNPDSVEPYIELTTLYPEAASRPWEVQELLRQGYERTGDPSLNPGE